MLNASLQFKSIKAYLVEWSPGSCPASEHHIRFLLGQARPVSITGDLIHIRVNVVDGQKVLLSKKLVFSLDVLQTSLAMEWIILV